jgi:Domain of Unknown Function (DUF349)
MALSGIPTPGSLRPPVSVDTSSASACGRVTEDGTVYLLAPEGEILVGQYAAGTPAEGLAFFARKYLDLTMELDLTLTRLSEEKSSAEQASVVLQRVREQAAARSFVGDVAALDAKCDSLDSAIASARSREQERKAASKQAALATREALVTEAESLTNSSAWKATTERYTLMVEEWKTIPRADRGAEQDLWKRLSAARTNFDKRRRAHFAEVDVARKESLTRKRELIAAAEALKDSTDWSGTSRKLRDLMGEWKKAPRGSKTDEDKLWKRFKAAQDVFYAAMKADAESQEAELASNVPAKEALVVEAEALLPITDVGQAKSKLRAIVERYEKVGDLPKSDRGRLEGRMKKIEDAIRTADQEKWRKSNPEVKARAESTANAFTDAIAKLEAQLAQAESTGNASKAADLRASIASTQALLGAAKGAAAEYSR